MVLDSSALLAILFDEPERAAFATAIERDPVRLVSAVSAFECSIVMEARGGADSVDDLDLLLARIDADIRSFGADDLYAARKAFQTYGKGRHPAALNFGDCIAYVLAKTTDHALLFKGDDFSQTDVEPAAPL
ncbi:MAG: type II toxin-antitoxin system VapC family toxin [Candidatus Eremiobacteraeota bacterium]|nr:type II toxin-antitoxin system VapC family toxin [Candidatus Eremiobacteraeota bacterium]